MTIILTKPVRVGGVELAAATTQTFSADVEADLVTRGFATPAGLKPGVLPVCANHLAEHEAIGFPLDFPNFRPTLLASLVAGATATRVGLTVTVTATAHGVPATTYDGFRYFIPPTPSLPSGAWASSVVRTDANTLTCTLPDGTAGSDFAGESINSGAAYTTQTELCVMTVPANTLRPKAKVSAAFMRGGDTTATTKTLRLQFAGSNVCGLTAGATPFMDGKMGFRVLDNGYRISVSGVAEGAVVAAIVTAAIDTTIDNSLQFLGTLSAGAAFLALLDAHVEIIG